MPALTRHTQGGIAKLVLDLPGEPVNKIDKTVTAEFEQHLGEIRADSGIRAVVLISGKRDNFIAGADINEFVALKNEDEALNLVTAGQELVNRFEDLGKPVVAAIHGTCLGGGFEATLACQYRIATDHPKTIIGLPEVQIGILPAAGGCQRLPRLIGVRAALDIILAGKTVPAQKAYRLGMVDELVHPAILEQVAMAAAERLAGGWKPARSRGGLTSWALDRNPAGRRAVFSAATKQVDKKTGGNYPAPPAALDSVEHGLRHGVKAGLAREATHFAELAVGEVSKRLVGIFFATTALKKDSGVAGDAPKAKTITAVGVVGAGFMGAGIGGTVVSRAQVDVRFRDSDLARVGAGLRSARQGLQGQLKRRRITKYEYQRLSSLLSGGVDWSGFGRSELVIEAVFEDLEVKHEVFRELESHVPEDTILASNTSTIPIAEIAKATRHPGRVLGMHFFSPVEKMPLLEVIVTEATEPWATVTAVDFGKRMGKTTIVVRDQTGFWVNRILTPYMNEAGRMVLEGVPIEDIDRAMKRFGFPVGPITLLDEVGIDVAQKASQVMYKAFGERMLPNEGIPRMLEDGRKGRKSGRGFYKYENGKKKGVDESVYDIVKIDPRPVPDVDIENRLVFSMLNESVRAYEERVVRSPRDGDMGAIFGIGFPPFRGGPLRYLDTIGMGRALDSLERLRHAYGDRFEACGLLQDMAHSDKRFYPDG